MPKRSRKLRQAAEARRLSLDCRKRQGVSDSRESASRRSSAEPERTVVPTTSPSSSLSSPSTSTAEFPAETHTTPPADAAEAVLHAGADSPADVAISTPPADATEAVLRASVDSSADVTTCTSPADATEAVPPPTTDDAAETSPRTAAQIMAQIAEEWVAVLDRDNKRSLTVFLCYYLVTLLSFTETRAAEFISTIIGKSDRTIRQWRHDLVSNDGILPGTKQGQYQRSGVLWQNEELNEKAIQYVHANAAVKGKPNLTSMDFCKWVNKILLPNSTLEPGYPRTVSVETARKWLHHLGFEVISAKKGIFYDSHEREDVIQSRKLFLRKMAKIGFLHFTNAPIEGAQKALPEDIEPPNLERRSKTVVLFHDESTFQSNEGQVTQWGVKGQKMIKPKSRGAGIMVSDFIEEHNGLLALSDEEYNTAKESNPNIRPYAREFLEIGESHEGYWTQDRFVAQMTRAIQLAELKYPKADGWRHVWVFEHSSCHAAMADDALDASKMNVKPGGKQRIMRDMIWDGRSQRMYVVRGGVKVAKGMKVVFEERGVSTIGMNADQMRETIAGHFDFKNEKNMIEHLLIHNGHIPCFLPKFHPELNPIERVWAQLKRFTKAHCKYTLPSLQKNIPLSYDSVSLDNIQNHFRKVRHYMFCYLEGLTPGKELDQVLKKYKLAVKSHRRIGLNE